MKLSSYLDPKFIFIDLEATTVEKAVETMVTEISVNNEMVKKNKDKFLDAVIKRERELSTAIGSGVGIPHARLNEFNDFIISIGILKNTISVEIAGSNQKDELKFIVLILSDVLKNKNILKTMGAISKLCLKNPALLEKLKASTSKHEIIKLMEDSNIEILHKVTADDVLSPEIKPAVLGVTLDEIATRFILEQTSGLPVVDKKGNFLGEITERELIEYGMPKYTSLLDDLNFLTVGEPFEEYLLNEKTATIDNIYRKKGVVVIDSQAPIMEICSIIVKKGVTRLYVVEKNKYLGMIKRSDIIKKILHI
ncbi:MAG: PTS sugar transporter subunit IIA [Fusobacteriaceae bacterium]